MWPPIRPFVLAQPVACLVIGQNGPNRAARRRQIYGKLSVYDRIDGRISPKQRRVWQ